MPCLPAPPAHGLVLLVSARLLSRQRRGRSNARQGCKAHAWRAVQSRSLCAACTCAAEPRQGLQEGRECTM